jgi:hypothetical protein
MAGGKAERAGDAPDAQAIVGVAAERLRPRVKKDIA